MTENGSAWASSGLGTVDRIVESGASSLEVDLRPTELVVAVSDELLATEEIERERLYELLGEFDAWPVVMAVQRERGLIVAT